MEEMPGNGNKGEESAGARGSGNAGSPGEVKREDLIEFVAAPFRRWWEYIRTGYRGYYVRLLKINLSAVAAYWAVMFLVLGLPLGVFILANGMGSITGVLGNIALLVVFGGLILAAIIASAWVKDSIGFTAIVLTEAELGGKDFSMVDSIHRLKWPALRYVLLESGIRLLLSLPLAILFVIFIGGAFAALAGPGSGTGLSALFALIFGMMFAYLLALAYIVVVFTAYGFIVQFWAYGFVIEGMGVVESLRRSFHLVKGNLFETIVFDVALWLGALIIGIPAAIVGAVLNLMLRFLPALAGGSDTAAYWAVYASILVVYSVVMVFLTTIVQLFSLPTQYLFWKKVAAREK